MVRVAIAGVGFMGKTHLGVYQRLKGVEVVSLCDLRKENTEITSLEAAGNIATSAGLVDLSGARKFGDYSQMLAAGGFDVVDICLPTFQHAPCSIQALAAGYHVFCEKPLALSIAEADRVLAAVKKSGRLFSVGQCLRFWPAYAEIKRIIDSGAYGAPRYAELARFSAAPGWAWDGWTLDSKRSGNAALDLHIHDVDMVLYLFGRPKSVRASGVFEPDGGISHIATLYGYPGMTVSSTGGWIASDSFGFTMRALFILERATIELDFSKEPKVALYPAGGKKSPLVLPEGDGYYHELADFVAGVERGATSGVVTGESARESLGLCLLEIDSARRRKELAFRL